MKEDRELEQGEPLAKLIQGTELMHHSNTGKNFMDHNKARNRDYWQKIFQVLGLWIKIQGYNL